jgi:hypothetical protein
MIVLQIEHPVPSFAGWKQAFDSDPVDRKGSRVRRYRVMRPVDNQNYSMIELEFDTVADAEAMLGKLRELWGRVEGTVMTNPQTRIVEIVEANAY